MPDTGAPWNIPYVAASDLVKDWPTDNQQQAEAVADALDEAALINSIVQTVKTDTFSTTSTSYVDVTGLTATITPATNTNKVLIIAQVAFSAAGTLDAGPHLRINGGNALTYVGDAAGTRTRSIFSNLLRASVYNFDNTLAPGTVVYLDSPATTSAVTYSVQVLTDVATIYINRSSTDTDDPAFGRGASSITLIEVNA